ncbi:MAG: CPBP family intramembrane metalloprotease [Treponema sp.]|nr:CPBP family intramembrane metalloprotease [Treponema sp.]
MGVFIEILILYIILFLSGSAGVPKGLVGFSFTAELSRLFMYNIPSLALIWYLLLKRKGLKDWGIRAPGKNDLLSGLLSLPGLLVIGFVINYITSQFNGMPESAGLYPPSSVPGWIILSISCISTGYLEESFFRFYILSRREELKLSNTAAILISTAAFSACHIYEGPWGFLNSFLAGILLCFIFLRYRSLHGIAIAHGLYNIAAFVISAVF